MTEKPKMGRPRISDERPIALRLPPDLKAQLERIRVEESFTDMNALLRQIVREWLKQRGAP